MILKAIDKALIINIYIFSFGLFISKGLTSISGGFVIVLWIIRSLLNKNFSFTRTKMDLPIIIFVLSIIASLFDQWNMIVVEKILKYVFVILFYYIVVDYIKNKQQIKKIILIILISLLISNIYGVYQYFNGYNRVIGFMSSLSFGGLLAISIIFITIFLLWGKMDVRYKIFTIIIDFLSFINLLFTKTRGAWLAFLIGIFSLFIVKKRKCIIISLIVLLISMFFILPNQYTTRFISSFDIYNNHSNLGRMAVWKGSLLMLKDYPINGVGLGQFKKYYESNYYQPNTTAYGHAHNNILNFAAETGLIGVIGFIYLMLSILLLLYKYYQQTDVINIKTFFLSSLIAFIVFNIHGLTEFNFGDAETLRFFWFTLALNMSIINNCNFK